MAINRALPDTYLTAPEAGERRAASSDGDVPRRTAMVVGGAILSLVSLLVGSIALVQVWLAPGASDGLATTPALQSWEAMAMIIGGGVGFAAGAALVGIGMGRWTSPRPAESDADYTGPGDPRDTPRPPRVV
ncbi:MAG: hypothetical protein ABIU38_10900 [Vicinamibacteraceae bacterium]